jgi:hypothetical protein
MTSDEIACLRALRHGCKGGLPPCECDIPGCLGDDGESRDAPLPVLQKLLDEREALLGAAKEAADGFDVVAADDSRLLALLRNAIAKAESP